MNYRVYSLKPYKDRKLRRFAEWLKKRHITANMVTITGLIFGLSAVLCLLMRLDALALALLVVSIIADLLDGTLARISDINVFQGKLLDALSDRMVETAWVGGLIFRGTLPWWGWVLPLGSILLLIMRGWAYHYALDTSFVRITRFERMAVLIGMLIIPWRFGMLILYGMVVAGTFLSSLMIFKVLWQKLPVKVWRKLKG